MFHLFESTSLSKPLVSKLTQPAPPYTADGKDRVISLLQFVALFFSGGKPGHFMSLSMALNESRRPFRGVGGAV